MMSANPITKDVMEECFKLFGKEYRKQFGKYANIEIILVGGAAVLAGHDFREMTMDIDAFIGTNASIKDLIYKIADQYGLANDWLNQDFKHTRSFSENLRLYSKHYRTYSGVLEVRTLSDPYLIATKLMAGRSYKKDLSDIVGILRDSMNDGEAITRSDIYKAFTNLYENTDRMPETSQDLMKYLYPGNSEYPVKELEIYMEKYLNFEEKSKNVLLDKQQAGIVLDEAYVDEITKFMNAAENEMDHSNPRQQQVNRHKGR